MCAETEETREVSGESDKNRNGSQSEVVESSGETEGEGLAQDDEGAGLKAAEGKLAGTSEGPAELWQETSGRAEFFNA